LRLNKICACFKEKNINCQIFNIEVEVNPELFNQADTIIIAYPIHSSYIPFIMRDFLKANALLLKENKTKINFRYGADAYLYKKLQCYL